MELNAAVKKLRKDIKMRYFNYQKQVPPPGLEKLIDEMHLDLPAVFVNGKPAFQGGLPSVEDVLEAVAELTA